MTPFQQSFQVEFLGPFRVATGNTVSGFDVAVSDDPLPSTSLKGAMRATARRLIGAGHPLIAEVFGSEGDGGAWAWTSADFSQCSLSLSGRSRIAIDPATKTVVESALVRAQHYEVTNAATAIFHVEPLQRVPESRVDDHLVLLRASALGTQSVGSDRNRGFGWVRVTADGVTNDQVLDLAKAVLTLSAETRTTGSAS